MGGLLAVLLCWKTILERQYVHKGVQGLCGPRPRTFVDISKTRPVHNFQVMTGLQALLYATKSDTPPFSLGLNPSGRAQALPWPSRCID